MDPRTKQPKTIEEALFLRLYNNGLFEQQAAAVIAEAKAAGMDEDTMHWTEKLAGLGPGVDLLLNLAFENLKPAVLAYIDREIPMHWARPMFTPDPLAEVNRLRGERGMAPVAEPPKPVPSPPPEVNDENIMLVRSIYRIQQRMLDYVTQVNEARAADTADWYPMDLRASRESPNAFYNQTASGLFLEFYYSAPSKLWTPWGELTLWRHSRGSGYEQYRQIIIEHFGGVIYKEQFNSDQGTHGPYFSLHSVDGVALPEPRMREKGVLKSTYEETNASWEAVRRAAM